MKNNKKKVKLKLKKKVKKVITFGLVFLILLISLLCISKLELSDKVKDVIKITTTTTKPLPDITIEDEHIYLLSGEEYSVYVDDDRVTYASSDEDVVIVNNGVIEVVGFGDAVVTVSVADKHDEVRVTTTDIISKPIINNKKSFLTCKKYSEEENKLLDSLLAYRISKAGYKTRAGAVAAARFLTLEFKYRIHYFYENGRLLTNDSRPYVDGEGRYYHVGLYLSTSKYDSLKKSSYGPAIWGCNLYSRIVKLTTPNGLDCSGYVSWLLLNAGFDVGDAGAGINVKRTNDLDDLGEKLTINEKNLESGKVKVGDLVSTYGHIGILIGMDEEHYYIAESLNKDLHVLTYTKNELLKSDWLSFVMMDQVYKEDGNLTNMW